MIARQSCILVTCDGCKQLAADGDDGVYHFDTVDQARECFGDDWVIADDGSATCPRCIAGRLCAVQGHDWSEWRGCRCAGRIAKHAADGCDQSRFCDRCDKHEYRPGGGGR